MLPPYPEFPSEDRPKYWLHGLLFVLTLIATTFAGAEWTLGRNFFYGENAIGMDAITTGFQFSLPFLLILTCHEMGHYVVSRYYRVLATLPYYIPAWFGFLPLGGILPSIGTFGAYIKIKQAPRSTQQFFDIGIAGPLAGFVVALICLAVGFATLPPIDYIFSIHPEFAKWGAEYPAYAYKEPNLKVGTNLMMQIMQYLFADPDLVPSGYELMHYPLLFAGYLSLMFTSLNLLPFGQLDGGHVVYGLIGYRRALKVMPWLFTAFVFYVGLGMVQPININSATIFEDSIWPNLTTLVIYYIAFSKIYPELKDNLAVTLGIFAVQYGIQTLLPGTMGADGYVMFLLIVGRFLGVTHPPAGYEHPLSLGRKIAGVVALLIFVLCFSPQPFMIVAE